MRHGCQPGLGTYAWNTLEHLTLGVWHEDWSAWTLKGSWSGIINEEKDGWRNAVTLAALREAYISSVDQERWSRIVLHALKRRAMPLGRVKSMLQELEKHDPRWLMVKRLGVPEK